MSLPEFRPGLEKALALAGSTHTFEDVLEQVVQNKAQLWISDGGVVITEVLQFPRKRVLRFWLATGELDAVIKLHRDALVWGAEQDCDFAVTTGRKGWAKPLLSEGWSETLVVLEQELGENG